MQKGFTLIELLVVVAIIGILASVVLVGLGSQRNSARESSAFMSMKSVNPAAIVCMHDDQNLQDPDASGIKAICTGSTDVWAGPLPSGWVYDTTNVSGSCVYDPDTSDNNFSYCAVNAETHRYIQCTYTECSVGSYAP